MNNEQLYKKIIEVETLAGSCRENIFLDVNRNKQLIIHQIERLQALLTVAQMILNEAPVCGG